MRAKQSHKQAKIKYYTEFADGNYRLLPIIRKQKRTEPVLICSEVDQFIESVLEYIQDKPYRLFTDELKKLGCVM